MKLIEIVHEKAIVPELEAAGREELVAELVDALIAAGSATKKLREELISRVMERENRGSTGFGRGVAVPHVKHPSVKKISAAIGLSSRGIDFNSLDKQPVYSVFLLLSPEDNPEEHLKAMEVVFSHLSKDTFRRFLRQASTVKDVVTLLEDADAQQLAT